MIFFPIIVNGSLSCDKCPVRGGLLVILLLASVFMRMSYFPYHMFCEQNSALFQFVYVVMKIL